MKTCFKCGQTKPIGEFYRHPQMADGHLGKCKDCTRADVKGYRNKRSPEARRQADADRIRKYRQRYPEKYRAHSAIGNALRDKRLQRHSCEICGSTMTEGHVRIAIQVLRELTANELRVPDDLACELIDAALDAINAPGVTCILCAINDPPPTPSA